MIAMESTASEKRRRKNTLSMIYFLFFLYVERQSLLKKHTIWIFMVESFKRAIDEATGAIEILKEN